MRVLITGSAGAIGSTLAKGMRDRFELRGFDRVPTPDLEDAVVADLADADAVRRATQGMDAVIHLGGAPGGGSPWEDVLNSNIIGTYNVFEAARHEGARRVAYASREGFFSHYPPYVQRTADLKPTPDSYYSVSKVFGESIGYMYAHRFDMEVVAVRIGNFKLDRPVPTHPKSLSPGDAVRVFECAICHPGVKYEVVYGVSDSNWARHDLEHGRRVIGYHPQDRSVIPEDEIPKPP